jgi:hypothetical protein
VPGEDLGASLERHRPSREKRGTQIETGEGSYRH